MGVIIGSARINLKKIDSSRVFKGKKGDYYEVQVIINDELDQFGNQIKIKESLSEKERESGKKAEFLGDGRVYFVDGIDLKTTKELTPDEPQAVEGSNSSNSKDDNVPF